MEFSITIQSQTSASSRFPGTRPFEASDSGVFFGRNEDIENLSQLVRLEKLVVLFGKSGYGKTSLLQAGIVPKLEKEKGFQCIPVRFFNYLEKKAGENGDEKSESEEEFLETFLTPAEIFHRKLKEFHDEPQPIKKWFLHEKSAWLELKKLQQRQGQHSKFLLVFDQFEEIFTYPQDEVEAFAADFSEFLYSTMPQRIRDVVHEKRKSMSQELLELLFSPTSVQVVFGIRTDRISLLNRLVKYFPDILKNLFELKPLDRAQAEKAIREPARKRGFFSTLPFDLEPPALEKVLDSLSDNNLQAIESFQLQVVCQYLEKVANSKKDKFIEQMQGADVMAMLGESDLGDLKFVYQEYYINLIKALPKDAQTPARELIEDAMISQEDRMRVMVYEGNALKKGVTADLLDLLVKLHLVRPESHPSGGIYYELCHDALVEPILKEREKRLFELRKKEIHRELEEKKRLEEKAKGIEEMQKRRKYAEEKMKLLRKQMDKRFFQMQLERMYIFMFKKGPNRSRLFARLASTLLFLLIAGGIGLGIYLKFEMEVLKAEQEESRQELKSLNDAFQKNMELLPADSLTQPFLKSNRELLERYRSLVKKGS